MKRAKNILLQFFFIFLAFGFVGVRPVEAAQKLTGSVQVWQERTIEKDGKDANVQCNIYGSCIEAGVPFNIRVSNLKYEDGTPVEDGTKIKVIVNGKGAGNNIVDEDKSYEDGKIHTTKANKIKDDREYEVKIIVNNGNDDQKKHELKKSFTNKTEESCDPDLCNENLDVSNPYKVCNQIDKDKNPDEYKRCMDCFAEKEGIWTAVGCIPQDPKLAVRSIVQIGLGIAGGIVLIMILVGAFMFSTSQGDPNKTKEAREIITSAIIGLIFVIFSVTMLQFIGVNILQIPGFGQ